MEAIDSIGMAANVAQLIQLRTDPRTDHTPLRRIDRTLRLDGRSDVGGKPFRDLDSFGG